MNNNVQIGPDDLKLFDPLYEHEQHEGQQKKGSRFVIRSTKKDNESSAENLHPGLKSASNNLLPKSRFNVRRAAPSNRQSMNIEISVSMSTNNLLAPWKIHSPRVESKLQSTDVLAGTC